MTEKGSHSPVDPSVPASALPPGTRLSEFEILRVLGVGGFGIVYLAFDHALEREVAVKEYMPASMAGRTETLHVSLRSKSDSEVFALGLRSFVNEAKLLARFDHPSLLKVHRFWEGNGTAYMAMPVLRGQTLKDVRQQSNPPPNEAWLREKLVPLLDALERLHVEGVYHRDIAPDNILIEPDGHPVLLDFGAARRVISDKTQSLTAILKPAYAPIEQYAESGSVKQGPWTDLYALGATLHYMLTGQPPAPATSRAVMDDHTPLAGQRLAGSDPAFLRVVDWMLAPRPLDRPQNVAELREALAGQRPPGRLLTPPPAFVAAEEPEFDPDATMVRPMAPLLPPSRTLAATPPVAVAPTFASGPAPLPASTVAAAPPSALSAGAPTPSHTADTTRVTPRPAVPMPPAGFPATLAAAARNAADMPAARAPLQPVARVAPVPPAVVQPLFAAAQAGDPAAAARPAFPSSTTAAPIAASGGAPATGQLASHAPAPLASLSDLDTLRAPVSAANMAPLTANVNDAKDAVLAAGASPTAPPPVSKPLPAAAPRSKALPVALAAVVALGVAAFAFWPQGAPTGGGAPPVASTAPAVAAPAAQAPPNSGLAANPSSVSNTSSSGALPAGPGVETAGAPAAAASATAGAAVSDTAPAAVVPGTGPAVPTAAAVAVGAAAVTAAAAAATTASAGADVAAPATKPPAIKPQAVKPAAAKPTTSATPTPANGAATATTPPRAGAQPAATPLPAPSTARGDAYSPAPTGQTAAPASPSSPASKPPEAPAKPAPIQGPEATCAGKTLFKRFGCMESECLRSELQAHPDCKEWRKNRPAHGT